MMIYQEKRKTITDQYYASDTKSLKEANKLTVSGKLKAGLLLLPDNLSVHSARVAVAKRRTITHQIYMGKKIVSLLKKIEPK